jgi:hypothetical protein
VSRRVLDLRARRGPDVPADVEDEHAIREVDLALVEFVQRGLRVGCDTEAVVRLRVAPDRQHDLPCEREVDVGLLERGHEPRRAAQADDLGPRLPSPRLVGGGVVARRVGTMDYAERSGLATDATHRLALRRGAGGGEGVEGASDFVLILDGGLTGQAAAYAPMRSREQRSRDASGFARRRFGAGH